jgi:hypothetical protein
VITACRPILLLHQLIEFSFVGGYSSKRKTSPALEGRPRGSPRWQYYLTNVCLEIGPLPPFAPHFPDPQVLIRLIGRQRGSTVERLPFLDTYRTMCRTPEPAFRRILEGMRELSFSG